VGPSAAPPPEGPKLRISAFRLDDDLSARALTQPARKDIGCPFDDSELNHLPVHWLAETDDRVSRRLSEPATRRSDARVEGQNPL
jgi:hypothetical protein